jgi:hypothetical protein
MNSSSIHARAHADTRVSGWAIFAASLMIVAGFFHAIAGLVALFKSDVYVATQTQLLVFDYSQWGWVHILMGLILMGAAFALLAGKLWGKIVAISLAGLSAIANFAFIHAYPLWSIAIIVLDVLIIYGVAMHGKEVDDDEYA